MVVCYLSPRQSNDLGLSFLAVPTAAARSAWLPFPVSLPPPPLLDLVLLPGYPSLSPCTHHRGHQMEPGGQARSPWRSAQNRCGQDTLGGQM